MKKFLTGSLTVMTIMWAMGLSAFLAVPTSAAVGDLVKSASSSTVYVVTADGVTICQFPHANVYKSWGYPSNFSTVMTKDLSSYTVGSNVEFRNASLVKGDGPAVYLVYNNMKRPIISDVVFLGLGYSWDKITWLSDAFLADYTTGPVVDSSLTHPDGQLVKYAGSPAIYLLDNGLKRPFQSGAAFEANRYSWGDVITIPNTETYPDGSAITGYEQALSLPNCIGTSSVSTGSGLTVALSPATAPAGSIIADSSNGGQALVPFVTVNFTASSDGDVKVTNLKFKRTGVSSDTSLDNMYLYDGNTKLTDGGSLSSGMVTFNNSMGLFTVPAGTTKAITVKGDLTTTASAGQTIGFELSGSAWVTTNGAAVSGSFPVSGNLMTVASVSDLGKVGVANTSVATTVDPGTNDVVVWQGTVYTTNQTVALHYIKFTSLGSIQANDLANFKLYDGGTLVSSVASMTSDREVMFDFGSNPINFTVGQSKTLKVLADVVKGSTRTYNFTIQEATDVVAKDTNYNVYLATKSGGTYSNWVVLKMTNDTNINSGNLSVTKASNSPSGNVAQNGTNVKVATFELKATGEDMKVKDLNVKVDFTSGYEGGLDNGKVFFNGVQVGSTKDLTENTAINFTFGSSLVVSAGTTGVLDIYADIRSATGTTISDSSDFVVSLEAGSSNVQKMSSLDYTSAPSAQVKASSLNVSAGSLSIAKYSAYPNQNFVPGSNNVKVGSAVFTAGSAEGVNVTSITVALSNEEAGSSTDMYLMKDGVQIGVTKPTLSTSNIFSVNFNIPASGSVIVDLYASLKSNAGQGTWAADISAEGTGLVTSNTVSASAKTLQTITISTGSLSATADASKPIADIVLAGTNKVFMNAIKFTALYDDFEVQELTFTADSGIQNHTGAVTLEYPVQGGGTGTAVGYMTNGSVTFTGLNLYVKKNDNAVLKVYVDVPSLSAGTISGGNGSINWNVAGTYKHVALGGGSTETNGATVSASNIDGNDMVVRKTRPTITLVTLPNSVLGSSNQVISKFTVAADVKGSIELSTLTWNVSTTGTSTLATPLLYVSGNPTALSASSTAFTANGLKISLTTPEQISAGSSKTYELKATIGGTIVTGDNVQTNLVTDAATQTGTINDLIGSRLFIWSDMSAVPHSLISADWASGLYVKNLPSDVQSLQK